MKNIYKIFALAMFICFSACDELDENLTSPVEVSPESVDINSLYNKIQLDLEEMQSDLWYDPAAVSRMIAYTSSYQYVDASSANTLNDVWQDIYEGMWPDIELLVEIAQERSLPVYEGTAKILKAYTMFVLVDMFGDVPYSEATLGVEVISPSADSGSEVYASAIALLDEAITLLSSAEDAAAPTYDNFYGGDVDSWIALANTLKLRAAVTTRLVDASASTATINEILSGGEFIDTESEDFEFSYGSTRENPNSRHPLYNGGYETSTGDYMSNYYMWLLRGEKLDDNGNAVVDPRIRYYFYRQIENASEQDVTVYSCHFSSYPDQDQKPDHYIDVDPRMPYCIAFVDDGYLGRDHLNGEGIPPDGELRTLYGLYPAGGQFDENSFTSQQQSGTTGAKGQGIWPLMLSSYVDFLRAEAALTLGTNDDARALLESGMQKSFDKVMGFSSLDATTFSGTVTIRGEEVSIEDAYVPTDDDVAEYIAYVLEQYDAASGESAKLDILMKEYYIALWGNGLEAYNMYRRTGMPSNMAPGLESGSGDFIRSYFYPAVNVERNANMVQKNITDAVFWDDSSVTLY
ncbi:SusD/RagB family nutrient-binding outer membrane lipoprotein [Chondrinema litorale]|uniref:SusD/RagB family nutrient-binding outer membrane lipoprotein n=1 Tax=Chondrinema litorale TaxID=2994555 RepID=UPI002543785C|nr:SusD/RagB family nutrient-binding outer membrane lipoprotein [Chondrinema litorale]UZR94944.1 SusD/RagB family nutrient-binding outer membrane lipoprotein [Chondrinema litorale]